MDFTRQQKEFFIDMEDSKMNIGRLCEETVFSWTPGP